MADYIFKIEDPEQEHVQGLMPPDVTAQFSIQPDGKRKVTTSRALDGDELDNLRDGIQDYALRYESS